MGAPGARVTQYYLLLGQALLGSAYGWQSLLCWATITGFDRLVPWAATVSIFPSGPPLVGGVFIVAFKKEELTVCSYNNQNTQNNYIFDIFTHLVLFFKFVFSAFFTSTSV